MVSMVTVQMGNEKAVRLGDSINGDLGKAAQGGCMAPCRGGVIISHHRQKVLGDRDLEDAGAPERGMRHAGREPQRPVALQGSVYGLCTLFPQ